MPPIAWATSLELAGVAWPALLELAGAACPLLELPGFAWPLLELPGATWPLLLELASAPPMLELDPGIHDARGVTFGINTRERKSRPAGF